MNRRIVFLGAVCASAVALSAPVAVAAPDAAACSLDGQVRYSPGVTTNEGFFTYTVDASLANCSGPSAVPTGGTISVGRALTINQIAYRAPAPAAASASCASFTDGSNGTAIVQWAGGGITVLSFGVTGTFAGAVNGSVIPSTTLTRVERKPDGSAIVDTIPTTRFPAYSLAGALVLNPSTDLPLCASSGVQNFAASGALALSTTA